MLPENDRCSLFRQQEFSLLGAPEAVKLPGVFDPDLVAAAAKISERNDLWESWPCGFLDQVVIGGAGFVRASCALASFSMVFVSPSHPSVTLQA